jgi:AraC family transcriptional regulator
MKLGPGQYFGGGVWERHSAGLLLTLSVYRPGRPQPWHCHANPTFFLLLSGNHRDHSRQGSFDQPAFSLVYHPTTNLHAGELGAGGMLGLNIEFEPDWLVRHDLCESDLGGYRPLDSARVRLSALRFVATAFQPGGESELDTQAVELLEPLAHLSDGVGERFPRWLDRAEDFLRAHFREPVSLRDAAREAEIHPVHLARTFRRRHACAVSEYVRGLRLAEAARLALEGASLAQAAYGAGFADQAHFSRCFSSALGVSPRRGLAPVRAALPR